jgi:hypothetical protein
VLDNASFAALVSSSEAGVLDEVSGVARFRAFNDGGALTEYVDWTHIIRTTDPEGTVILVRNGVDSGTWSAEGDGRMTLNEHALDSVILAEMTADGKTLTLPPVENSPGALHLAVFTCDGDNLTVTVEGRSSVMTRER